MAKKAGFGAIRRTLQITNYRNYMVGNFCSQVGMWVQRIAIQWLTWELTHSPTWLGIIAFADMMPIIIISPFAGALTDRVNPLIPLRLAQIAMTLHSLALFLFTFSGAMTIWILLGLAIISGANQAL